MPGWFTAALRKTSLVFRWGVAVLVLLLLLLIIASRLVEEPLRARIEQAMNQHLDGYSVSLPGLDFRLLGFSLTLSDLTIIQDAHPEPPVARFPRLHASVHWRDLLFARLVAEFEFDNPQLHINLIQLRQEMEDPVPVEERGWQEAFESIYPLRINHLEVTDGQLTYIDEDPDRPLDLTEIHLEISNIRNIRYPDRVYPSPFRMEGNLFKRGLVIINGQANFLTEPYPGMDARIDLRKVPLDELQPLADRTNIHLRGGTLDAAGRAEYSPDVKEAVLENLHLDGIHLDYVQSPETAELEERQQRQIRRAAETVEKQDLRLRADQVRITGSVLGYVNRTEEPYYRIFLDEADLRMNNFSDGFRDGPAQAVLTGKFMGSGQAIASARFRPVEEGSDFDLNIRIEDTHLPSMNDLLRAYAGLDVAAGRFSLFSELAVRGDSISGYVKPFFIDIEISAPEEDEEKGIIQRAYEWVAGAVLSLLEGPEDELATRADISGTIDDPQASTFQIIINLILNSFFDIILPGFEGEVEGVRERIEAVTEGEAE